MQICQANQSNVSTPSSVTAKSPAIYMVRYHKSRFFRLNIVEAKFIWTSKCDWMWFSNNLPVGSPADYSEKLHIQSLSLYVISKVFVDFSFMGQAVIQYYFLTTSFHLIEVDHIIPYGVNWTYPSGQRTENLRWTYDYCLYSDEDIAQTSTWFVLIPLFHISRLTSSDSHVTGNCFSYPHNLVLFLAVR